MGRLPSVATGLLLLGALLGCSRSGPPNPVGPASPPPTTPPTGGGGPPVLGTVAVLGGSCNPGPLPDTRCLNLRVSCPRVAPIDVTLRITSPARDLLPRGTIVWGSGTGGQDFYDANERFRRVMDGLRNQGFQIVQRAWVESWFIVRPLLSWRDQSCRYATLLNWIHARERVGDAFCAGGTSTGATELAYALARWGGGDLLDLAVFDSGPHVARLDGVCAPDPAWLSECSQLVPRSVWRECQPRCIMIAPLPGRPDRECPSRNPEDAEWLRADSPLSRDATISFPATKLHVLLGTRDCTEAPVQGLLFMKETTNAGPKQVDFVSTPHVVFTQPAGAEALNRALSEGCIPRR